MEFLEHYKILIQSLDEMRKKENELKTVLKNVEMSAASAKKVFRDKDKTLFIKKV